MQAVARQLTGEGELDVLPGENQPSGESVELRLMVPEFPVCGVTPGQADAGDSVVIEATGFGRSGGVVTITLGDGGIGTGGLDASVSLTTAGPIPVDAPSGLRLVTMSMADSALAAACSLQINDVTT